MYLTEASQIKWKDGRFVYLTIKYCKLQLLRPGFIWFCRLFRWAYLRREGDGFNEDIFERQK